MRYAIVDSETRSTIDIRKVGAIVYGTHPSTDVLCISYCIVTDGVRSEIKTWVPPQPIPPEIIALAADPEAPVVSFNDLFDRTIEHHVAAPRYGWPIIPLERRRCAQAVALSFALPAKLDKVAEALRLTTRKTDSGKRAMLALSKPRKARKGEDRSQIYWVNDPAKFETLYAYNRDDVAITAEIIDRFGSLPAAEQTVWTANEIINERGVYIDRQLLTPLRLLETEISAWVKAEIKRLSGGNISSPHQRDRILGWLRERGCVLPDLRKETVAAALELEDLPDEARVMLDTRAKGASAAVHKFKRLDAHMGNDSRVRGNFRYHGAGPGRFTATGPQVHNLRKPREADVRAIMATVQTGDLALVQERYANPLSALGEISRALIQAAPDTELFIADFSGVESRGAAWNCGEQWKVDAWATYDRSRDPRDEPYFRIGKTFGFADSVARERGKVGDLAFGYQGGLGAWRKFAGKDDTTPDAAIREYRDAFRGMHPKLKAFWDASVYLAVKACRNPGTTYWHERIGFYREPGGYRYLFLILPSGRRICYPQPKLFVDRYRGEESFTFMENTQGKWWRYGAGYRGVFGGVLLENVTQGICRDLLCEAILRVEQAGFRTVLHLHDELVVEVDKGTKSLDEFRALMRVVPSWATGFPIESKARISDRFIEIKDRPTIVSNPRAAE
jgi:DNA polymerase